MLRLGLGDQELRKERKRGHVARKENKSNLIFFFLFFFLHIFFFNLFSLSLPMLKVEVEQKGKRTVNQC